MGEPTMNAGSNPLFDRHRPAESTTINNVPVFVLHGHLPEPYACPECGYPVWDLDDPQARLASDATQREHVVWRAEWSSVCMRRVNGQTVMNLACQHPYHLVPHTCSQFRPHPAFPAGLIVSAREFGRGEGGASGRTGA